jgi:hypothetical protein
MRATTPSGPKIRSGTSHETRGRQDTTAGWVVFPLIAVLGLLK